MKKLFCFLALMPLCLISCGGDDGGEPDSGKTSETTKVDIVSVWKESTNNKESVVSFAKDGTYKIEAWGAQGGEFASTGQYAGKGGYASGFISYTEDEFNKLKSSADNHLYLYVGEKGKNISTNPSLGGWNGGGPSGNYSTQTVNAGGGGGATDIRLEPCGNTDDWDDEDSLHSRIMVAGGGGGSGNFTGYTITGGAGGGLVGGSGTSGSSTYAAISGGTQTVGGINNTFGANSRGQFGYAVQSSVSTSYGGGGGGGYYGGAEGFGTGGSGGSGYVSGHEGCSDYTDNNKVIKFSNTKLYDGESGLVRSPIGNDYMTGNSGDGYAKITYMGNGDVKVNDITCVAYLTKDTPIDFEHITFLTADCNDAKNNSLFAFDQNLTDQDYNVITLAAVYSFER